MPLPFVPSNPEGEEVQLRVMDAQVTLDRWTSYEFGTAYQEVASGFTFIEGDERFSQRELDALTEGARVRLSVNGIALCDGHIDDVDFSADRSSGQVVSVTGRERIGLVVDAIADPTLKVPDSTTLADMLKRLFEPFGWVSDEHFVIDNAANRLATRGLRGTPMTKGGKRKGPKPLKSFVLHQLKPHNHEGVYEFAKRVASRHGLHIRQSEDGERIIVDQPNYAQPRSYQLRRGIETNVLGGRVKRSFRDQAAVIIADGASGSGEFGFGKIKAYVVNPYYGFDKDGFVLDEVSKVLLKHPTAQQVTFTVQPHHRSVPNIPPRIVFLHDEESRTQEQLNNFVRREMSKLMCKALTASYTVEGHGQIDEDGNFVPWLVDTVAEVQDDVANLHELMWVSKVHYHRSRGSGSMTTVDLMRLGALQLGVAEDPPPATVTRITTTNRNPTGFERYYELG